jgi:hypothetical protein
LAWIEILYPFFDRYLRNSVGFGAPDASYRLGAAWFSVAQPINDARCHPRNSAEPSAGPALDRNSLERLPIGPRYRNLLLCS